MLLFNSGQIVVFQIFIGGLADPTQGFRIKGIAQTGFFQKVGKYHGAAKFGVLQVSLESGLGIFLDPCPEVQGYGLSQAVVDVIEGLE